MELLQPRRCLLTAHPVHASVPSQPNLDAQGGLGFLSVKGLKFNLVSFVALVVSYLTFILSAWALPEPPPQLPQALGIVPALFVNYFLDSYWTFKHAG